MEKIRKQVEKLKKKLRSSKDANRKEAVKLLGEIAKKNPDFIKEAIPSLITELEDLNSEVRSLAVVAIGNVGEYRPEYVKDAVPFLINCLNDNDSTVRRNALEAVGRIGKNAPEEIKYAIPSIINNLRHEVWRVRREATSALSKIGENSPKQVKKAIPYLIECLGDANKRVRIDAAKAIAKIEKGNLQDDDWQTRREAAKALGKIGKHRPRYVKEAIPLLLEKLEDPSIEVRNESANAIIEISGGNSFLNDALPILISALNSKNEALRKISISAIKKIAQNEVYEEDLLEILFIALESKNAEIKSGAALVIGEIGSKNPNLVRKAVPLLLNNVEDGEQKVQKSAIKALDIIGEKLLENEIKPELCIMIETSRDIHIGEWKEISLIIVNRGSAHAEDIEIEFVGALEMRNEIYIPILKIGKSLELKTEIKPKALGKIPIAINTTFHDFKGTSYNATDIGWIDISKKGEKFKEDKQIVFKGKIGRKNLSMVRKNN